MLRLRRPLRLAPILTALLVLLPLSALAGPKADAARTIWQKGDLLTALEQLRAVGSDDAEEIDACLVEAEICLELRYVPQANYNLSRASDLLAASDPRQAKVKALRTRAAATENLDIGDASVPVSERMDPSVDAIRDGNPTEARNAFARVALQLQTFDHASDLGVLEARVLYPARADLLAERRFYDEASADYRLALKRLPNFLKEDREKVLSHWAAMLAELNPPPRGTPEYEEYASVLSSDTSGAGAAVIRRSSAEAALLDYDAKHDLAELVSAKVDDDLARGLSGAPTSVAFRRGLAEAASKLDSATRAEWMTRCRARFAEQVLAFPTQTLPVKTAERLDRMLEQVVRAEPNNVAAWTRRREIARQSDKQAALDLILAQFKAGAPVKKETLGVGQRTMRERPYEADGYIAALEECTSHRVSDETRRKAGVYLSTVQLLAPESLETRRIEIVHREWARSDGEPSGNSFNRLPVYVDHLLDVAPRDPALRLWTLRYLQSYGTVTDYGDIKPRLDRVLTETPDYVPALERRANSAWTWGKRDAAIVDYRRLTELQPGNNQALASLGFALFMQHQFKPAAEVFAHYSDSGSAGSEARVMQALALAGASEERSEALMRDSMNNAVQADTLEPFIKQLPETPLKTRVVQAMNASVGKPGPRPSEVALTESIAPAYIQPARLEISGLRL